MSHFWGVHLIGVFFWFLIFGGSIFWFLGVHLGGPRGGGTPKLCPNILGVPPPRGPFLGGPFGGFDFWGVHLGGPRGGGTPKLCPNICLLNICLWRLSPRLESKPCSAQPACDANHVTSRRCWCLQEGCLEHALIGGVTFAFFSLSELRRRKLFWVLFRFWNKQQQQATTATYFSSTSTF